MGNFLEQFMDTSMEVDMGWDPDQYEAATTDRLATYALIAHFASEVPRRLGGDATSAELSRDRKLCKVLRSRHLSLHRVWREEATDIEDLQEQFKNSLDGLRIQGAQMDWKEWWTDQLTWLRRELTTVSTTAFKTGHLKRGNSFANRLVNEIAQMQQVMDLHGS